MKIKYFIFAVLLFLVLVFAIPQTRYYIKYKVFGVLDRVFLLHVGQLNLLVDQIDLKRKITIFGYLIKDKNKYFIVSDENMAKIMPLLQASQIVLLTNENNELVKDVDPNCLNRYVKVSGKLDKLIAFNTIKAKSAVQTVERDKEGVVCPIPSR